MKLANTAFLPDYANWQRFNLPLFSMYLVLHLTLLAVPFTFSWQGFAAFWILYFCTICLGITVCYHRLLAHRSYKLPKSLMYFLALLGCLASQRGPIWWVACHRLHHSQVDKEGDPHSPSVSFLWSHFLWAFFWHPQLDEREETIRAWAPELYDDPGLRFLENYYTLVNALFLVLLFGLGYLWGGWELGLSVFVWGGLFRITFGLHITWLVNSAAHLWGYRTFDTKDKSRNNWWVALLTWGEGWHNNHHAHPRSAKMGLSWFELDVTYWVISLFRSLGLATHIITASPPKSSATPKRAR